MSDQWLKKQLDSMDGKLDKLDGRVDSIDVTVAKQEQQLRDHIRRTSLAEENIELLRTEIKPVQKHVYMVNGALKLIGLVATLVGIATGISKLLTL